MRFDWINTNDADLLNCVEPNELVRRVQAGCADSATELSNRFTPRLIVLLERRLEGRRSDAEDVAQEALAKAFQNLNHFDFNYRFSTWLYTIAIRLAVDLVRKEKRRPKIYPLESLSIEPSTTDDYLGSDASDRETGIWQIAKKLLPKSYFSILWLKYAEELSIQEIATVLNRTQIGVRVQLHRARIKLSTELNRMDRENETLVQQQPCRKP